MPERILLFFVGKGKEIGRKTRTHHDFGYGSSLGVMMALHTHTHTNNKRENQAKERRERKKKMASRGVLIGRRPRHLRYIYMYMHGT